MKQNLLLIVLMAWMAISGQAITVTDTIFDRKAYGTDFAFGADVGFVSQMESWGTKWLDKNGNQKDILQILKEQGINNVRLRVWVNPSGGWCGKEDVVKMAKRAKAKGMGVMLSFHYSDSWADPGTQDRPAAWKDHTVAQLEQDVYDHTKDVITALQAAGITPRWAQIGNETKRGMFYPTCQTNKGGTDNFARMLKAGIKACHDCDSSIVTIIHLPDGHDNSLYRSMFDALKSRGVKWDMIGMSAYPRWSHLDGPTMITKVMANIKDLEQRYGTKVMVVETGHYWNKPIEANNYLVGLMDKLIQNGDPGCFYWEPESMAGYDLGAWDHDTNRPTVAMDAYLGVKHTEVAWLMKASMQSPVAEQTIEPGEQSMEVLVQHQRKGRIQSVEFHVDKKTAGMYRFEDLATVGTVATAAVTVADVAIGPHTAWAKATDNAKNIQITDTVTFFVGESSLMGDATIENGNQKGGTARWGLRIDGAGKYRMAFKYSSPALRGTELRLDGDSIARIFFMKNTDTFQIVDIEVSDVGSHQLQLTATGATGLPDIYSLRIFPLDSQPVPMAEELTGIKIIKEWSDCKRYYNLNGVPSAVPHRGINIVRQTINGKTNSYKIVKP
jgi:arabinogalactan endo-1,4-beta-galactosidase